jgi:hypothetical protein
MSLGITPHIMIHPNIQQLKTSKIIVSKHPISNASNVTPVLVHTVHEHVNMNRMSYVCDAAIMYVGGRGGGVKKKKLELKLF